MAAANQCWICGGKFPQPFEGAGDGFAIDCTTCGKYTTTGSLHASASLLAAAERYRFSFWNKRRTLEGREPARFATHNVAAIVAELPNPLTHAKADILLVSITLLHPEAGRLFKIDQDRQRSLACARNGEEMGFFMRSLVERGDLVAHHRGSPTTPQALAAAGLGTGPRTRSKRVREASRRSRGLLDDTGNISGIIKDLKYINLF